MHQDAVARTHRTSEMRAEIRSDNKCTRTQDGRYTRLFMKVFTAPQSTLPTGEAPRPPRTAQDRGARTQVKDAICQIAEIRSDNKSVRGRRTVDCQVDSIV